MKVSVLATVLLGLALSACEKSASPRDRSQRGGTIVVTATSDPDALFPPSALNMQARQATELIYEYLADVGPAMNTNGDGGFVKEIASDWQWSSDSSRIAFHINPDAKWHDGRRVTSRDVAFSYSVYTDSLVASETLSDVADIDSVSTPDPATAVFWFARRTPHQFYDAASLMLILPEHIYGRIGRDSLRAFASRTPPVGSGRFRLASWVRGSHFELDAVNNHYRGRAKIDRLIWTVTPDYKSAVTKLLGGEADVFENLRPESIRDLATKGDFNVVSLPGMDYVFMQLNLADASGAAPHRLFGSRDLRRAITMALDRKSMVTNLFDTLASVSMGPTVRAFPSTDTSVTQIPFDRPRAEHLLDSLGWRRAYPGAMRSRNGVPLRFNAIVPVSSLSRLRIAVMIQEQLSQAGVDMRIEQMDYSAFAERQASRSFDAALASWHLGSSPDGVKQTWTTAASRKRGLNYGSYANRLFDALVDSALNSRTLVSERGYFKRANQTIIDDAPAVWLYEPRFVMAIHKRIHITPTRPSAWWLDIGRWTIPLAEQIARDKVANTAVIH